MDVVNAWDLAKYQSSWVRKLPSGGAAIILVVFVIPMVFMALWNNWLCTH